MKTSQPLVCLTAALLAVSANADDKWDITKLDMSKLPPPSEQTNVTFAKDIQPIFESSCTHCHGEEHQRGHLRLDTLQNVLKGGEDGKMIVPGDSKSSLLVAAIAQVNSDVAMPPKRHAGGHRPPPGNEEFHNDGPPPDGGSGPGGPPKDQEQPNDRDHAPGKDHPPGGAQREKALTAAQISLVRAWIDQGSK